MLRQFYVSRASDRQWALLMLEFRLFALRHPALRARLAATHRRIRASLRFDIIDDVLRANKLNDRAADATKIALEALLNCLVLEHAYDPQRISLEQIKTQLARYFDSLLH